MMDRNVLYYSNSTATFNILTCGDIHPHPGPEPSTLESNNNFSTKNRKNRSDLRCFHQNAGSLKSGHKLREFQDTVYVNQYDIVAITDRKLFPVTVH